MNEPRPRPEYGEYADVPPSVPVQSAPAPPRRRRTWDVVLTTALLLWGVLDVVNGWAGFSNLGASLRAAFEFQGLPPFASGEAADQLGAVLNIVRAVLLVVGIALALLLLSRNRVAFWAPLGAGVIAGLVVAISVMVLMIGDPGFAEYLAQQTP